MNLVNSKFLQRYSLIINPEHCNRITAFVKRTVGGVR